MSEWNANKFHFSPWVIWLLTYIPRQIVIFLLAIILVAGLASGLFLVFFGAFLAAKFPAVSLAMLGITAVAFLIRLFYDGISIDLPKREKKP